MPYGTFASTRLAVDEATDAQVRAAVAHAMAFETWQSLTQHGMSDEQAQEMMVSFVTGIDGAAPNRSAA